MKFHVMHGQIELGEFVHESTDAGMGLVVGELRPTELYAEVQPFFRRLSGMLDRREHVTARMWTDRDQLALALLADDGTAITTDAIMIYDFGEELDLVFEAILTDSQQLLRYFMNTEASSSSRG